LIQYNFYTTLNGAEGNTPVQQYTAVLIRDIFPKARARAPTSDIPLA
jgi:hypothetical protein